MLNITCSINRKKVKNYIVKLHGEWLKNLTTFMTGNIPDNCYPHIRLLPTYPHLVSADFIHFLPVATSAHLLITHSQLRTYQVNTLGHTSSKRVDKCNISSFGWFLFSVYWCMHLCTVACFGIYALYKLNSHFTYLRHSACQVPAVFFQQNAGHIHISGHLQFLANQMPMFVLHASHKFKSLWF